MVDSTVILAGAIPAALLALIVDGSLLWLERRLSTRRRAGSRRTAVAVAASLAARRARSAARCWPCASSGAIVVGSKNFTEQLILGEIVAQTIERETGLPVQRRLNLGGTLICDRALLAGDIDVYVEYTGTALTAIFHQPAAKDPQARHRHACAISTRAAAARCSRRSASTTRSRSSSAAPMRAREGCAPSTMWRAWRREWRAGFGYEFLERPDGYPGLAKTYGLTFRSPPQVMDLTLSYRALASGQVDLIAGDATAGLIKGLDLVSARRQPALLSAVRRGAGGARVHAAAVSAGAAGARRTGRPNLRGGHAGDELRGRRAAREPRRHRTAIPESATRSAAVTRPSGQGEHNDRMRDKALRDHLARVLDWEDAHVGFDKAVDGIPADKRGARAPGFEHSPWQLLEHIRLAQDDILDFCVNAELRAHHEMAGRLLARPTAAERCGVEGEHRRRSRDRATR